MMLDQCDIGFTWKYFGDQILYFCCEFIWDDLWAKGGHSLICHNSKWCFMSSKIGIWEKTYTKAIQTDTFCQIAHRVIPTGDWHNTQCNLLWRNFSQWDTDASTADCWIKTHNFEMIPFKCTSLYTAHTATRIISGIWIVICNNILNEYCCYIHSRDLFFTFDLAGIELDMNK